MSSAKSHKLEHNLICVGRINGPHGVRGELRVQSYTAEPDALFEYQPLYLGQSGKEVKLKKSGAKKGGFIARIDGISDRNDAEMVKGHELFVDRATLGETADDEEFFVTDLAGLKVRDLTGIAIGQVRALENFGAEDLLEIILEVPVKGFGRHVFVPFRKALVPDVDVAGGWLSVDMDAWSNAQIDASDRSGDIENTESEDGETV